MELGIFSLSLAVKNIEESVAFYEHLGFTIIDGGHINDSFKDTPTQKWRILKHSSLKLGLFQGMFEQNILTFNPSNILSIQESLKEKHVKLIKETSPNETMKSVVFSDPDGNQIMLDQH
ncbi:VOC family protein [Aquimarina gracilis]|uniref:VOC family protein n=1 Tax=Aquimarina gracilis TaxID=874422 RepID=A0ABU6A0T1_9FLAO|nr:VOC family protein [Aquimarina gracilis]MEB3347770.1 VOC family protein [Aquimarina gracilis]